MARIKKNEEDLEFCFHRMTELFSENNKHIIANGGYHTLNYASIMKELIIILEKMSKEDYREMVIHPILPNGIYLGVSTNKRLTWRKYCILSLPFFIELCRILPREYEYSVAVEIFMSTVKDHSFDIYNPFFFEFCKNPDEFFLVSSSEHFRLRWAVNNFMQDLHERLINTKARRKALERKRGAEKNYKEAIRYFEGINDNHARILVARLDIFYKKGVNVSIEDLANDIKHFKRNMRHNKIFQHSLGFIEKLEFGVDKGPHAHLLMFFNASERDPRCDIHLTRLIGEYWLEIVGQERGDYWNCNANKQPFEINNRLGIGEIHFSDKEKIENLYRIIRYFCKVEQFLKPKTQRKMKLFLRGKHLKRSGKKRGAPRVLQRKDKLSSDIVKTQASSSGYISQPPLPWAFPLKINHSI